MNEKQIEKLIEYIQSGDWIVWSCGRSTDYVDEFWKEGSIENLVNKFKELSLKHNKKKVSK